MTENTATTLTAAEQAVADAKAALKTARDAARTEEREAAKVARAAEREAAKATKAAERAQADAERAKAQAERVPEGYEINHHYSDAERLILKYVATEPWLVVCEHGTQKTAESLGDARAVKQSRGDWCDKCKADIAKAKREAAAAERKAAAADAAKGETVDAAADAATTEQTEQV